MGAGTIFEEGGQERIWRVGEIFLFTLLPRLSNLLTLDIVFWVGESASLPTQFTKHKTRIVYLS